MSPSRTWRESLLGDLDEDRVAGVVAEPVVDRLEAVEVAEEDREPLGAVVVPLLGGGGVHMVVVAVEGLGAAGPVVEAVPVGVEGGVAVRRVHGVDGGGVGGLGALTEPGGEPRAQFGGVRQPGEGVVRGAVGELELAALAVLYVLDVGEEEAGPVGGVGDDGVAEADPDVGAVPPTEAEFGPPALGGGAEQGAYVLGVDEVGEGVAAHRGGGAAQQAAQGVVGPEYPTVLVAAHLGYRHAGGGVLEGLPEAFLTGAQGLLLAFEPYQCPLHIRA